MNPALRDVSGHMVGLGLNSLAHALRLALYRSPDNECWSQLSVLNAAHAAEILVKARIADEHPLLIFSQVPRSTQADGDLLNYGDLFGSGRTYQYNELPERLWAVTGIRLANAGAFQEFGRLRNTIQHFAAPSVDASQATLDFVFGVLDPFINAEWDEFAIDHNEEMGDHYGHIFETLVQRNIRPLLSPCAARAPHGRGVRGPD